MSDEPKNARQWDDVDEAVELLREREYDDALASLRAALDRDPRNPYAHHFMGAAHFELGDFESARDAYEKALSFAPDYLGSAVGLGHALRMMGRLDEAQRAGERALAMAGKGAKDGDVHYLLGLVFAARGEAKKAIAHLESFLESNPELEARYDAQAMLDTLRGKAKKLEPV
jgi:tetratricopeptide (TPR) repeat protein